MQLQRSAGMLVSRTVSVWRSPKTNFIGLGFGLEGFGLDLEDSGLSVDVYGPHLETIRDALNPTATVAEFWNINYNTALLK